MINDLETMVSPRKKNVTTLFRGSPGFPFARGEINRSLMRRRFSPTCNPHFVQPNFPYFSLFSFLFPFFFFYLSIVLVHLIPNRSRLPPRRVTSMQTTRKRGPRSAPSVERALVAEIECSFPVLAGIEVVNRPADSFRRSTLLRSRERDSPPGRILTRGYRSMIEGEVY